ncbi:hypothetical protein CRENPOLYSF2_2230002 [Crenothrix polyspora]|uniref:Uncharacterized protein n=1 Tax=Crenothrix polyspora TaxID=360316 RepID=A0A1R4H5A4_9GAMM|nr:hypothetical protein CRENPOLYSF2_2230002 [Crenothrix polyspora]
MGACAINGGLPALRNFIPLEECLAEASFALGHDGGVAW